MNKTPDNQIPIDVPKNDFGNFLTDKDNRRILFSAKFGMGKTYFLKKFFEENQDKYEAYHLFPVRYQILSNENILEFLKYDVVLNLLQKKIPIFLKMKTNQELKFTDKLLVKYWKKKKWNLMSKISGALPGPLSILSLVFDLLGFTEEEKKKFKENSPNITNFINKINLKNHLIGEDYVTDFILQENKKTNKKTVLILDDFDRIDPEHIFKMLNVFSSQMEDKEENKFAFNHIIIVADYENIKNIFHHKYGANTNFEGYFDKFFTVKPYHFTNKEAIMAKIPELLKHIKHKYKKIGEVIESNSGTLKQFLEKILIDAFNIDDGINLRRLFKPINYIFPAMKQFSDEYQDGFITKDLQKQKCEFINIGITILISMFEGKELFLKTLKIIEASLPRVKYNNDGDLQAASVMIKKIIGNEKWQEQKWLDKYTLINSTHNYLEPLKNNENLNFFFYETLIEYVKKSKYNRTFKYN